jgi:amino acid transporter
MSDKPDLFLRKATGLVRSWSVGDAFIYAFFSINIVTLGLYTMSQAFYFQGGMIPALLLGALLIIPEIVVYAGLISAMPRAGGDYVWQSRILGGGLAYVLSMTGWCFILWLWTPLYADMLRHIVIVPLAAVLGFKTFALGVAASPLALFLVALFMCLFVTAIIAWGMKAYARVQKICFWLGNAGLAVVLILLFTTKASTFPANFDKGMLALFGVGDAYAAVSASGSAAGASTSLWGGSLKGILLLLPYLAFFNLWPNWGATLYGEVKGAQDFKKNFWGMAAALIVATLLAVLLLLGIDKAMSFDFYMKANASYWSSRWNPASGAAVLAAWPYPAILALFATPNLALRLAVLVAMSAWFFGWCGTIFLSSTRILFSASFDRLLPEAIARVSRKTRTPVNALLVMVIPGLAVSALYAWNLFNFASLTLVSTLVIAITFLGTSVSATILPFVKRELYAASPLARFRLGKLPLITVFGALCSAFLLFLIYEWLVDPAGLYGISYKNSTSVIFMLVLYALAVLMYLGMRAYRRRSGIDVNKIYHEIPVE